MTRLQFLSYALVGLLGFGLGTAVSYYDKLAFYEAQLLTEDLLEGARVSGYLEGQRDYRNLMLAETIYGSEIQD